MEKNERWECGDSVCYETMRLSMLSFSGRVETIDTINTRAAIRVHFTLRSLLRLSQSTVYEG